MYQLQRLLAGFLWLFSLAHYYKTYTILGFFPSVSLLLNAIFFCSALINLPFSSLLLLFTLPLIGGFSERLEILGFQLQSLNHLSFDIIVGYTAAAFWSPLQSPEQAAQTISERTQVFCRVLNILCMLIIVSALLSIPRNLVQSTSLFSLRGFIWNLWQFRSLSWYDDFFPLFEILFALILIPFPWAFLRGLPRQNKTHSYALAIILASALCVIAFGIWQWITLPAAPAGTRGVSSLFPEIHSLGSYLLGVVLFGFALLRTSVPTPLTTASRTQGVQLFLLGIFIFSSVLALILSGSRSSIGLLLGTILFGCLVYVNDLRQRSHRKIAIIVPLLGLSGGAVGIGLLAALLNHQSISWIDDLWSLTSFERFNRFLTYRPEIYLAAFKLFALNPLVGIGSGGFFRTSSVFELTNSPFLLEHQGENAHNYYLQILAENGLSGALLLIILGVILGQSRSNPRSAPYFWFLVGILLSNLLGHSLLLTNLSSFAIALALLALSYLPAPTAIPSQANLLSIFSLTSLRKFASMHYLAVFFVSIIGWDLAKTFTSTTVLADDFFCQGKSKYWQDQHISGNYTQQLSATNQRVTISLAAEHTRLDRYPLTVSVRIWDPSRENRKLLSSGELVFTSNKPSSLELAIPPHYIGRTLLINIESSRCFTPINWAVNHDRRRLGVKLLGLK